MSEEAAAQLTEEEMDEQLLGGGKEEEGKGAKGGTDDGKGGTGEGDEGKPAPTDETKEALAELARHVQRVTAPKEEPKVLSEDEKEEMWGVWNPTKTDPDYFRKFLRLNTDMEPAEVERAVKEFLPLFKEMQKGLVRQAVVGARNLYTMDIDKLREELKPLHEYVSGQRAEATRNRFESTYESLADPKYKKIVDATARSLADKEFDSEEDYFKALAEGAADVIKGVVPDFDLGAGKKKTTTKSPSLPRTSAGSGGGAGKSTQSKEQGPAQTEDAAAEVLD